MQDTDSSFSSLPEYSAALDAVRSLLSHSSCERDGEDLLEELIASIGSGDMQAVFLLASLLTEGAEKIDPFFIMDTLRELAEQVAKVVAARACGQDERQREQLAREIRTSVAAVFFDVWENGERG